MRPMEPPYIYIYIYLCSAPQRQQLRSALLYTYIYIYINIYIYVYIYIYIYIYVYNFIRFDLALVSKHRTLFKNPNDFTGSAVGQAQELTRYDMYKKKKLRWKAQISKNRSKESPT